METNTNLEVMLKDKVKELFDKGSLNLDNVKKILPYIEIDKDIIYFFRYIWDLLLRIWDY